MPKITFSATGASFEVPDGTSFLEFCQDNDAPHEFGCMIGSCGTCRMIIESGVDHVRPATADMTDEEEDTLHMVTDEPGARLGCQLTIHGDITVRPAKDR